MKILIVEDDAEIAQLVSQALRVEGFLIEHCDLGADALRQASVTPYDLLLLDWTLPDGDGLALCRELRRVGSRTPILMLTARGTVHDRILGLESGADDYLVKPFDVGELVARVRALLRRSRDVAILRIGSLEIDRLRRVVRLDERLLDLTSREYALLLYMVQSGDSVISRAELLAEVWGTNFDPGSNLVEVNVSRLRDKLGACAWVIETVRGQKGYRLRRSPP